MTTEFYRFPCGCAFPVKGINKETGKPMLKFNLREDFNESCPVVWDIFHKGLTVGVFQLETPLGRKWARELKPNRIEDLEALTAILRPGCLEAKDENNISLTDHYCRRKNGVEEPTIEFPEIADILRDTYQILVYQEQQIFIAEKLAGLNKIEADKLRSAVGKKNAKKIEEVGVIFVEGCIKTGLVNKEQAEKIFGWIKAGARYNFNACFYKSCTIRRLCRRNKHGFKYTIEDMYKIKNDLRYAKSTGHYHLSRKWRSLKNYGVGLSMMEDGKVRPNIIKDIRYVGKAPCFKIVLENGSEVICTLNHKFPTNKGVKTLMEIERDKDILLYVCGEYEKENGRRYNWSKATKAERWTWNKQSKNPFLTNGAYTEWRKNKELLPKQCMKCGAVPTPKKRNTGLEIHHKDGNRENGKLDNLEALCVSCYKKSEYAVGSYPASQHKVKSIEFHSFDDVYDVEMEAPNHNLVVNDNFIASNSHGASYGIKSFQTAYLKAHFPAAFFKAKLIGSQNKQNITDKVSDLVNDAKLFNIEILPPKLSDNRNTFYIKDNIIRFGLQNIKGVGDSSIVKIAEAIKFLEQELGKSIGDCSLYEIMVYLLTAKLSESLVVKLIESGSFDYLKVNRRCLLDTFGLLAQYKTTESKAKGKEGLSENTLLVQLAKQGKHTDIVQLVEDSLKLAKDGGCFFSQARLDDVKEELKLYKSNGGQRSYDNPLWVAFTEEYLFGAALTCKKIDAYDSSASNITCKEFICGKEQDFMVFAVDIDEVKEYTTTSGSNEGKKNALISISDGTGKIRARAWSDTLEEYGELLKPGNSVIIRGERGKKKFSDTLTIRQVIQAVASEAI